MKKKLFLAVLFITLGVACFGFGKASAASFLGNGITTSPISLNLNIKPGSSASSQLMVENNGTSPVQINLKVEEFISDNIDGYPKIYAPKAGDPSVYYVSFNKNNFVSQPKTWTPVEMTINIPTNASLGYYYAILFTPKTSVKATNNTTTTLFKGSNAVLVLVDTHSSNEIKSISVSKFTSVKSVYQYLPATFNIAIKNSGNIHLIPQGDIYISRSEASTKPITSLDINPNQGNVLPSSTRNFQVKWNDGFPVYKEKIVNGKVVVAKNGQAEQSLSWNLDDLSHFRFGKYYAHLALVYSNGSQDVPINAVVSFWVIPWTLIIIFIVVLIILAFGVYTIIRNLLRPLKKTPEESKDPSTPEETKTKTTLKTLRKR